MGNNQTISYCVPVTEKPAGETAVYRHPDYKDGLLQSDNASINNLQQLLLDVESKFSNLPYLSSRNPSTKKYESKTYSECVSLARNLGSGIINKEMINEVGCNAKDCATIKTISVFSKNREEWFLLDLANALYGFTLVPLYDTLGADSSSFILNQSEVRTIFISGPCVKVLLNCESFGMLQNVVLFDECDETTLKALEEKGLKWYYFNDILLNGKEKPVDLPEIAKDQIFTFSYTSGTTGTPKGAMMSHFNFVNQISAVLKVIEIYPGDAHLSYLPLPHVFERVVSWALSSKGSNIHYYQGDVLKLKEDIADVKPHIFVSVPRLYNKFHDAIKKKLEDTSGIKGMIVSAGIYRKMSNVQYYGQCTHSIFDPLVFNKTREVFGGRLRVCVTASAPISKEVMDFLKICSCVPFIEAYGQTECSGASFSTLSNDLETGHVGGPCGNTEFKLVDIPDMKYFSTDKDDDGNNMPRGEICVRGPGIFRGYFKEDEKTRETLDEDGWLHSGDVGLLRPNGSIKIIDRKKNIFKLAQGEYIAPEKIENIYVRAKGVAESFVYGDSLQSHLVGIVVPDKDYVMNWAENNQIEGSFEELCHNQKVIDHILKSMTIHATQEKLHGFEKVKQIHLEPVSLQLQGLVSTTFKLKRNEAKLKFLDIIDKLYAKGF